MLLQVQQEYVLSYNFLTYKSDLRLFYDLYKKLRLETLKKIFKKIFLTIFLVKKKIK